MIKNYKESLTQWSFDLFFYLLFYSKSISHRRYPWSTKFIELIFVRNIFPKIITNSILKRESQNRRKFHDLKKNQRVKNKDVCQTMYSSAVICYVSLLSRVFESLTIWWRFNLTRHITFKKSAIISDLQSLRWKTRPIEEGAYTCKHTIHYIYFCNILSIHIRIWQIFSRRRKFIIGRNIFHIYIYIYNFYYTLVSTLYEFLSIFRSYDIIFSSTQNHLIFWTDFFDIVTYYVLTCFLLLLWTRVCNMNVQKSIDNTFSQHHHMKKDYWR